MCVRAWALVYICVLDNLESVFSGGIFITGGQWSQVMIATLKNEYPNLIECWNLLEEIFRITKTKNKNPN